MSKTTPITVAALAVTAAATAVGGYWLRGDGSSRVVPPGTNELPDAPMRTRLRVAVAVLQGRPVIFRVFVGPKGVTFSLPHGVAAGCTFRGAGVHTGAAS